ncbi:membrane protein YknW [Kroppenstedtia guangzhouensis]|uniref:Membrane protein YknW n=1 Tax=Kroppenstedtia guangzhouensis TaxID=1274356 RepID=A0ABQ1G687_9BACL|nr:Yip1 family protein [Kroppenstedtia guangzhouensis]GGA37574.1 membrane protein YknW [Kroppenstedtia guangzhouensis]
MSDVQTSSSEVRKPSLLGVLFSPTEQFERIREKPRFGMALTILMVLSVIILSLTGLALVENPIYMEKAGVEEAGLPPEAFTAITIGSMLFGGVIGTPVLLLLRSLFHWLFMMLFRGEASFKQLFSLNTHLYLLPVLSSLIYMVYLWVTGGGGTDPETLPTSLSAFVSAEGFLKGLLGGIEIFAIWELILTASGLSIVGRLSKGKGWAIALIIFGVTLLMMAGFTALGEMADSMAP